MTDSVWYTNIDVKGSKVMLRYVEDQVQKSQVIEYQPELYIKTNDAAAADAISMHNEPLERVCFDDNKQMRSFMETYKDINGFSVYGSDSIMNQFVSRNFPGQIKFDPSLIKCAILDIETFSGDIDADGNPIDGPFPDPMAVQFPVNLITLYNTTDKIFYVWGLEEFKGRFIGTYKHNPDHPRVGNLKVVYKGFKTEYDMLMDYVNFWKSQEFNCWSGWYIEGFDNPYLTGRIEKICGESAKKKLSYWGIVNTEKTHDNFGAETIQFDYLGCQMLDYKSLFEKHGYMNPDNLKLQTVATMILGEGKIDYADEGNLNTLYIRNYQKAVEYNIVDVNLIVLMNNKKKFLELTYILAYLAKCNYRDTLGTVKPWSACAYSMLYDKGVRPRIKSVYQGDTNFGGGFVRVIVPGRYRWVVSTDLNSLYPHIIQGWNLGGETLIEPEDLPAEVRNIPQFTLDDLVNKRVDLSILKKYNICMTANRQFYTRDKQSIFNEKTREIYSARKQVKGEMLALEQLEVNLKALIAKNLPTEEQTIELERLAREISFKNVHQNSLKIFMNSLFGALGNKWFKEFFDIRVAEGITTSGQWAILWIARKLDEYFNKVLGLGEVVHQIHHQSKPKPETILKVLKGHNFSIYQDTDSNYLDLSMLVDKLFTAEQQVNEVEKIVNFLDNLFQTKIEPYMNECYKELADYCNAADQRMFMKREVIAPAAIWTAKKRYTMLVADSEGVRYFPDYYHKIVGLDAVKASYPKFCREWMEEGYKIALVGTEEEEQAFIKSKKVEFMKLPVAKIATPTGVNGLEKWGDANTIYSKGSPMQVKAALWHNHLIDKLEVQQVPKIKSGDKILFVKLRHPNNYNCDAIGFQGKLPAEFKLDKYIDYESNYQKCFIDPMENLLSSIGWSAEKKASIMDWFD